MKRCLIACMALLLCLPLGACAGGQPPALGFDPAQVESATVYTGGVPAAAMKKEVEDARQIASLLQLLEQVQLGREATEADTCLLYTSCLVAKKFCSPWQIRPTFFNPCLIMYSPSP